MGETGSETRGGFADSGSDETMEHLYKVLVIGDFGVGKTSIIRRYTQGTFCPNYKLTIGVDFSLKTVEWDSRTKINTQLWDIAGHERFGHMTRVYYKFAIAAIIVFDLTRQATFDSVLKWLADVNQKVMLENGDPVPVVMLANKSDLENQQVDQSLLDTFCTKHNILAWFPTSAKENTNIEEAMKCLLSKILDLSSQKLDPIASAETECIDLADLNTSGNSNLLSSKPYSRSGNRHLGVSVRTGEESKKHTSRCCSS